MHANTRDPGKKPAKRSSRGTKVTVDELVAKSHTVFDRVMPFLERAASKLRRWSRLPASK